jgi:anti-anti-sigma regulatory factor
MNLSASDHADRPDIRVSREGDAWILALAGDHDATSVVALNTELAGIADHDDPPLVVIDVTAATHLDSRMIGAILGWHATGAEAAGVRLAVATGPGRSHVADVLVTVSAGTDLRLVESPADALDARTG